MGLRTLVTPMNFMVRLFSDFFRDESGLQTLEVVLLISLASVVTAGIIVLAQMIFSYARSFINIAICS